MQRDRYFLEREELEVRPWGKQYLACLRTVWVKLDLLGSKFSSCVHIIAQIDPAKGTLAQELPPAPIDGGTGSYRRTEGKSIRVRALSYRYPASSYRGPSCPLTRHHHISQHSISTPIWNRLSALVNQTLRPKA